MPSNVFRPLSLIATLLSRVREERYTLLSRRKHSHDSSTEHEDGACADEMASPTPHSTAFRSLLAPSKPKWMPNYLSRSIVAHLPTRNQVAGKLTSIFTTRSSSLQTWLRERGTKRRFPVWMHEILWLVGSALLLLVLTVFLLFPSYSSPPLRYTALRGRVGKGIGRQGAANIHNEHVFIAASLYDPGGKLVSGDWAESVSNLIHILGPQNVHFSLYENNVDLEDKVALVEFEKRIPCNKTIVVENLNAARLPHVTTPDGEKRLKRIQFLAEVRNRALRPLDSIETRFDKLLYLNVVFDPVDAANLLFSTNVDETGDGRTRYHAACALDFDNPFKFYDTYASRDVEGYGMGLVVYPWFTSAGSGISRQAVLDQKDAVPVSSCWGGMVAFEAKWFQESVIEGAKQDIPGVQLPLRFRAETDLFWDASECCLIHADLSALSSPSPSSPASLLLDGRGQSGIYMNPYIRVAYSSSVLRWLRLSRRIERLFAPFQSFVNLLTRLPSSNPRRLHQTNDEVIDRVWVWNAETQAALLNSTENLLVDGVKGAFEDVHRRAMPGSFCGSRSLSYLLDHPNEQGKMWAHAKVPKGG